MGIAQPKQRDQELVEVVMSLERHLLYIVGVHVDLVVVGTEVEVREEPRAVELI